MRDGLDFYLVYGKQRDGVDALQRGDPYTLRGEKQDKCHGTDSQMFSDLTQSRLHVDLLLLE